MIKLPKIAFLSVMMFCMACFGSQAQMRMGAGIVPTSSLPAPVISKDVVRLDVPHIRQKPWLCVPTSSAMILRYFGERHDPVKLKAVAEGHKPKSRRNTRFTYWVDMRHSLRKIGKNWYIRDYPKSAAGYRNGWNAIKKSLRAGNPVMVDVHLGGGHTFVVMGYNEQKKLVYIRDPDIPGSRSRALSYAEFQKHWHNHRFANSRSVFFARKG